MSVPKYRLDAIETIGRKILQEYDPALLDGPPQAVPIETIIETKFDSMTESARRSSYCPSAFLVMLCRNFRKNWRCPDFIPTDSR